MRLNRLIVLVGLSPLLGCTMVSQAVHNIEYEKALRADLKERSVANRQIAMDFWLESWVASGDAAPEPEFVEGFVDGFADFLDHGGVGEAPPVPPKRFWSGDALNPEGRLIAQRYLDGFAIGATAARESGLRRDALVVVRLPGQPLPPGTPPEVLPPPEPAPEPESPVLPKSDLDRASWRVPMPVQQGRTAQEEIKEEPFPLGGQRLVGPWPGEPMPIDFSRLPRWR